MQGLRAIALPSSVVVLLLFARQVHADLPQVPVAVDYAENYRNTTVVVQHVQHIFIGKVIGQVGNAQLSRTEETQTSVRVLYNLKGHLAGAVTVDWFGSGYTPGTTICLRHPLTKH